MRVQETEARALRPTPPLIVQMSFQPAIPRRVALQQSPPPLRRSEHQYVVIPLDRSRTFHRTVNCALTVCVRPGGKRITSGGSGRVGDKGWSVGGTQRGCSNDTGNHRQCVEVVIFCRDAALDARGERKDFLSAAVSAAVVLQGPVIGRLQVAQRRHAGPEPGYGTRGAGQT